MRKRFTFRQVGRPWHVLSRTFPEKWLVLTRVLTCPLVCVFGRGQGAPSVQMQEVPPPMYTDLDSEDEDKLTGLTCSVALDLAMSSSQAEQPGVYQSAGCRN